VRCSFRRGTKQCRDIAFARTTAFKCSINYRAGESGVAFHFPPQPMTLTYWLSDREILRWSRYVLGQKLLTANHAKYANQSANIPFRVFGVFRGHDFRSLFSERAECGFGNPLTRTSAKTAAI
jgi:hypothetical protein